MAELDPAVHDLVCFGTAMRGWPADFDAIEATVLHSVRSVDDTARGALEGRNGRWRWVLHTRTLPLRA